MPLPDDEVRRRSDDARGRALETHRRTRELAAQAREGEGRQRTQARWMAAAQQEARGRPRHLATPAAP